MKKTAYDSNGNHISLTQLEDKKFEVRCVYGGGFNASFHKTLDEANKKFYSYNPEQDTVRPEEEKPVFATKRTAKPKAVAKPAEENK